MRTLLLLATTTALIAAAATHAPAQADPPPWRGENGPAWREGNEWRQRQWEREREHRIAEQNWRDHHRPPGYYCAPPPPVYYRPPQPGIYIPFR